jgi:hypothetical protein
MSIATIVIALIVIFIAWKVLSGVLKIGAILLIVVAAAYVLSRGAM